MPRKRVSTPTLDIRNRVKELRYVRPSDLADHPQQWRIHGELQQQAMQGLLREVGIAGALLAYESPTTGLTSIDGHLRKSLADTLWPTLILDVTDEEARLLLASYDPVSAMAETNRAQLAALLADVTTGDAGVQALLAQLAEANGIAALTDARPLVDVEPEVDRAEALREQYCVEMGQLWQCGQHRLLCADSRDQANIVRVLDTDTPEMVWADPPYGVNIVATNGFVGGGEAYDIPFGGRRRVHVGGGEGYKARHGEYAIARDKRRGTDGAAKPFGSQKVRGTVGTHAPNIVDVGKYAPVLGDESPATATAAATMLLEAYPAAVHVWWGGNYYADALPPSSCWLVWDKETTGNFADCELAWTNQAKAARLFHHRWNGMLRDSERERRWHPTQKPAALAAWAYETLGQEGDVILDPFLGCGPSVIAAQQRGRRVCGLEMSPDYIAIILHRWSTLTGQTPQRLG